MVTLFQRDQSVISIHIKTIFKEGELDEISNMHFLHITNSDKPSALYSLDVIISVGYRVNSKRGTQFRIKGYSINEKRLKDQAEQFLSFRAQRRIFLNKREGKVEITLIKVGNLPTIIHL